MVIFNSYVKLPEGMFNIPITSDYYCQFEFSPNY